MLSAFKTASIGVRAIAARIKIPLPPRRLSTASLSTSAPLRTADDRLTSSKLPSYGPVGVARSLQASPTACTSLPVSCARYLLTTIDSPSADALRARVLARGPRRARLWGEPRDRARDGARVRRGGGARGLLRRPAEDAWRGVGEGEIRKSTRRRRGVPKTGGEGRLEYVSADVRDRVGHVHPQA